MAGKNKTVIAAEIKAHMDRQGGPYGNWYAGIASDIEQRLFSDHNVPRKNHWFIYREAFNVDDAREVEQYLFSLGCKGGPGGGDDSTKLVYAYLISATTRE